MFSVSEVKRDAKVAMRGKYGEAILAILLLNAVALAGVALMLGYIVVIGALIVSKYSMYLDIAKFQYRGTDSIYGGFRHFWRSLKVTVILVLVPIVIGLIGALLYGLLYLLGMGISILFNLGEIQSEVTLTIIVGLCAIIFFIYLLNAYARLSMAYYLVVDRQELNARSCVKESIRITKRLVLKLYLFWLSFLAWVIGCILTAGILYLRFGPYF